MHQHATGSADHDRSFAELVTEQRRHRNHRDGLHRAAVLSDGATRLVDRFSLLDWPSFLSILAGQGQRRSSPRSEQPSAATRTGNAGHGASATTTPPPPRAAQPTIVSRCDSPSRP
jgi:hypothetical protein